ncbi:hypothetical protein CcCBS67573_g07875 [Chytriomyces confervae]|uniref:GPN-loop GTPase 3 n=1 Tax=Chytriomyces confervae TaxID=246404 RepID=A0A507EPY6_9FUNG|nr:hypothetical protein CcCBS67573_g07875 [Chytriomyces confervae]
MSRPVPTASITTSASIAAAIKSLGADEIDAETIKKNRSFRKFSYRGVDLEQLLDMSSEQLTEIVHARARRRFQRGLKRKPMGLIKKLRKAKKDAVDGEKPETVKTHLRNMIIVPEMVGSVVGVYNGKVFNQIEIKAEMIGHYLAEFSITYKPVGHGRPGIGASSSSNINRSIHLVNLDPAAEHFEYKPSIDIRDLITLEDVVSELQYGPNGGLVYCLEYLCNNMDWLEDQINSFEDDYLIIDCPGQIELYTHFPIMRQIVASLDKMGYRTCGVYLLDSQFVQDVSKFFSGVMSAMSAMVQLEVPHINVLSKMDLLGDKAESFELERYFNPDPTLLMEDANKETSPKLHALNRALVQLIEEFNMVSFIPLNIQDEDSVGLVLSHIDNAIQYGEDVEPKEPKDMDEGDPDEGEFDYME